MCVLYVLYSTCTVLSIGCLPAGLNFSLNCAAPYQIYLTFVPLFPSCVQKKVCFLTSSTELLRRWPFQQQILHAVLPKYVTLILCCFLCVCFKCALAWCFTPLVDKCFSWHAEGFEGFVLVIQICCRFWDLQYTAFL